MTLFSHRLYLSVFACLYCLIKLLLYPGILLYNIKTTISEKIPLRHLLYSVHTFIRIH